MKRAGQLFSRLVLGGLLKEFDPRVPASAEASGDQGIYAQPQTFSHQPSSGTEERVIIPHSTLRTLHSRWLELGGLVTICSSIALGAPAPYDRNSHQGEGWNPNVHLATTARESPWHSGPTPDWTNTAGFEKDVFSFARVRWTRMTRSRQVWWNGGYWYSDSPDSDLNLSFRLQQLTSMKVNPNGRIIDLTDPELFDYPWIYMVEPGLMILEDAEVPLLRKYLLNGGFLMTDDCWGQPQWANVERELKRVLPEGHWVELEMDHPIFHSVYDLKVPKDQLQIPNVVIGRRADVTGVTWEFHEGEVCRDIHFRALFDAKNRLMVMGCYNTDNGDGWEREGEDVYFFHRFSENIAYPLGINIIVYSMTH